MFTRCCVLCMLVTSFSCLLKHPFSPCLLDDAIRTQTEKPTSIRLTLFSQDLCSIQNKIGGISFCMSSNLTYVHWGLPRKKKRSLGRIYSEHLLCVIRDFRLVSAGVLYFSDGGLSFKTNILKHSGQVYQLRMIFSNIYWL